MRIFICNRKFDSADTDRIINEFKKESDNTVTILREEEHSEDWKIRVEKKFHEVDFVLFVIGAKTFKSEALTWEYGKAKQLNKRIIGIQLSSASEESILFCKGFQVFDNVKQCFPYLQKIFETDRQLLLEQYKIMVSSTERVTDQRLKVNNLFFTVTSSILSISLVVGKAFEFSAAGAIGMILLAGMAFYITFLWEKLVLSYGKLNTGKFIIIDHIEKLLRTNMFEHEWNILRDKLNYEPNTQTEASVVRKFRFFIIIVGVFEIIYTIHKINWLCLLWYL
jgi:hypothetical protein